MAFQLTEERCCIFVAEEGNIEMFELLVKTGKMNINVKDALGTTPLMVATQKRNRK